ncbi:MAG: hypothetical protein ACI8QC_002094 [Planctomycetota bacterium]|jgi:hypothetical protein
MRSRLSLFAGALGFVLGACGSAPNRQPETEPRLDAALIPAAPVELESAEDVSPEQVSQPEQTPAPVVSAFVPRDLLGHVAGSPVFAAELLQAWLHRDSREVSRYLDKLVLDKLVVAEAKRLGIQLPPAALSGALAETRRVLEAEIAKLGGGTVEQFIEERLGLDATNYLRHVQEAKTIDLLASRCVRAFLMENDRIRARMLVVTESSAKDLVEAGLAQGKDFSELAKEFSKDASGAEGGHIADLVRATSGISRLAFTTPVGEVGGPLFEGGRWLFLRVDGRIPGRPGTWKELGPDVEASLLKGDLDDLEYLQWQADVLARYEVDTGPFLKLVGEPVQTDS